MEHISEIIETTEVVKPITTGMRFLDRAIGGYYPGELTAICGEENSGKTAFVVSQLNLIAVEQHIPTMIVLNNMSRRTFLSCMAAYYYRIPLSILEWHPSRTAGTWRYWIFDASLTRCRSDSSADVANWV